MASAGGQLVGRQICRVNRFYQSFDIYNWPKFNSIYALCAVESMPARAVVPTRLLHFGSKIEIEVVASQFLTN